MALVTGAGRGIGRATAAALAAEGYAVVLAERVPGLGRSAERALRREGADALFLATDVADPASVGRTLGAVLRRFGRLDCVVNNAGVLRVAPLVRLPRPALERMLEVNLLGPILVTRAALPAMLRRRSGSIVNVASLLGKSGLAEYAVYCASKFGLVGFTEALADELRGTGVKTWAVCPGLVDTAMGREAAGASQWEGARLIRPERVARVIADLARGRRRIASGATVDVTR